MHCDAMRARRTATRARGLFGVQEDGDDEAVQAQDLSEDEDEDHADEEAGLLGRAAHARVADDADGEACGQSGQPDGQPRTQVDEAPASRYRLNVSGPGL